MLSLCWEWRRMQNYDFMMKSQWQLHREGGMDLEVFKEMELTGWKCLTVRN